VQTSVSPYVESEWTWSSALRTTLGIRGDLYRFRVRSDNPLNSGSESASLVSPKVNVVFSPWRRTEAFVNAGLGFHSNDARGATIRVDPSSGEPVDRVTPLVRGTGAEVGVRTTPVERVTTSISLWTLHLDSELLFIGDAGTTESSRPSRRTGVEWSSEYRPTDPMSLDVDFAISRARFTDDDPTGDRIPGAIEGVGSGTLAFEPPRGLGGSLNLRYFGPRSLIEDNSVRSRASTVLNGQVGYRFAGWMVSVDLFNLFDAKVNDIDYYYASRLPGEPAEGVEDFHTHPQEPREVRLTLSTARFD
jgi:hypothetical protein